MAAAVDGIQTDDSTALLAKLEESGIDITPKDVEKLDMATDLISDAVLNGSGGRGDGRPR